MTSERILYNITYLKWIRWKYPDTVDIMVHSNLIATLWGMFLKEQIKEDQ